MKRLKAINYLFITVTLTLTVIFLVNFLGNPLYRNDGRLMVIVPYFIAQVLLVVFSLIITIKTHQQNGVLLFALFLSLVSEDFVIQSLRRLNADWMPFVFLVISYALTGTVFIKALQNFPRHISKHDIQLTFPKNKIIAGFISRTIRNYTWFVFPVLIAVAALLRLKDSVIDLFILITALLSLYVNYKQSASDERNKILWLFWGLITYAFLTIIRLIVYFRPIENPHTINLVFNILLPLVLVLSLSMSLFFSNTFDTGILISRTLVDGFIFIFIVLIYNIIEHYFLHWLSHELGVSDVFLSSTLSGIFVLAFSPIHHKLMHFLKKRIKKDPV